MSVRKIMGQIVNIPIHIMDFFIVMFFMVIDHFTRYAKEYITFGILGIFCLLILSPMIIFGIPDILAMPYLFIVILLSVGFAKWLAHYTF